MDFIAKLFDTSDFPARWWCGNWTPALGWLHILSDVGVWAAYFAIPLVLGYFVARRRDLPFRRVFILFVAFILLCGTTHLMEAIIFWWPAYRLAGALKLLTAIVSWVTVLALVRVAPSVLAMRTPEELEREVAARTDAERQLKEANAELERRVEERTADLARSVAALQQERELLRTTLLSIGEAVVTTDRDGNVTGLNRVAESLTGWTNAESLGHPLDAVFCIVNESTREPVENPALRALTEGVIVRLANHTVLINRDGTERPIDGSAAPIRGEDGELVGSVLVFRDLGEKRRLEGERQEAQERVIATLESVTDGFMRYDRDWRIVFVNAEAERINKLTRSEMLGRILWDVFPALVGTKFEAEFRRAVAEQVTVEFENHYEPFGRWYFLKGYPTADGGLTTFIRDITEQKVHQEVLAASEARFRELADAMPQIVYVTDAGGRIEFINRQWFDYTGQVNTQSVDHTSVVHPVDLADMLRRWEQSIATGTPLQSEFRLRRGTDGENRWFLTRSVPVRDAGGQVVMWYGTSTDIHDQKMAEQEIARLATESERQRRLYETVLTNTPDLAYVFDLNHRFTYANHALLTMWGKTWGEAIGKNCLELGYEPWHAAMHSREIEQVVATKQPIRGEVAFTGTHGRRQYDYIFVPVIGADGEVEAVAGTTRDVTERKRAEEEIARLAAASERQRRLYETVLTNTPDFMYVFSLDHKVLYANDALIKMWGRGHDGAIGKTFLEIGYAPWHAEMHDREIDQVRATRQPIRGEVPFDGTHGRRMYEYIFVPVIGADGEVEAVAGTTRDVTERHEAEAALRESEERSAFVRRSSGVGFWYCDLPFDVLQWDELVKAHFHLPPDAAVTIQTFYDRLHPDDREPTRRAIERSIGDRTPYNVDYRTVDPNTGTVTWLRAIGRTFYAADGTPTRFDGVTLDVSDQKRAEEQQAFLIRLADTLRPLFDPVEVQAEASRVLGEQLGANRVVYFEIRGDDYVIERDYTAGVRPLAGRYPVAAFGQALLAVLLDGRTVIEADATIEPDRPPGERAAFAAIQVRGHVDVPLVKGGRFVAGMTVHVSARRDWTRQEVALIEETAERTWAAVQRVRAEQEVARLAAAAERERRLFAAVLSNTPDFIYTFDLEGRFVYVNSALLALWGKRLDEAVGRNFFDLDYPPTVADKLQRQIRQVIETRQPVRDETPYTGLAGEREYEYIFAPVLGMGGAVEAVAGSTRDITDRKRAEEELRRLAAELTYADRRKDEFLATLAHELRNPLAPIRNGLEVIRRAGSNGTIEQARSMMERQLTQLIRLVDDLLEVSRVTSGKLELRRAIVELRAVIAAAVETSRPAIEEAGQQFTVAVPDGAIWVDGDVTRLAQVVSNLLNNSAKYTHRGGQISLTVARESRMAVVSVRDDGIGIPPAMLEKVFGMFAQVDRALEKTTGGLGIGLSLVKGLVEMHGGTIEARSEGEGRGSEFVLRLPVVLSAADKVVPPKADEPIGSSSRRRILVADDNVDSAETLGQLLELLGNEVSTANDGLQAVDVAEKFRPDLILLDIGMPKLNGYETCRRIREQPWSKKAILVALTGWGQAEDKRRSQEAGFDLHLVKPVDPSVLEKLLAGLQPTT